MALAVRQQLRINDVKIVEDSKAASAQYPTLRLGAESGTRHRVGIHQRHHRGILAGDDRQRTGVAAG